ncbi:thiosulfate dehydrogenase [quinone] large subunit [Cyclobacterium xiamenense]|uniref:Thiosulfate dehydrogenase [quinone] large subunit n=1 Tax=Cyclobacterium xiamenense TaxID=1297121 RepID=A0A1H7A481_9BACT|nr:Rieske (2Fe-2S) protein [Cyclobacterium xiamenense]SEJ56832.1 thiosulfate dehydrogenase [quinone] large subunit [Cyclobacterium xiamenense]
MKKTAEFKQGKLAVDRRQFLEKSGMVSCMALFGLGFFTSCTEEEDPMPDPDAGNGGGAGNGIQVTQQAVQIDLDRNEALASSGGWLLITQARVLVVNVNGQFNALTSVCTHSQCDRNWSYGNEVFTCSCHGSRFDTNGQVVNGPASSPLRSYGVSRDGDNLTISLS